MRMSYFRNEDILQLTNKSPKSDRNHCLCKGRPLFNKEYKTRKPQQFLVLIIYVYFSQKIVDYNTTTVNNRHVRVVMYLDFKSKGRRFDPIASQCFFLIILAYNFSYTAQNNFPLKLPYQMCLQLKFNHFNMTFAHRNNFFFEIFNIFDYCPQVKQPPNPSNTLEKGN